MSMKRLPRALLAASLVAVGGGGFAAAVAADGIAVIRPDDGGRGVWTGDRMHGARERLKDVLPGRHDARLP